MLLLNKKIWIDGEIQKFIVSKKIYFHMRTQYILLFLTKEIDNLCMAHSCHV